ncbi:hypothetical protein EVAR_67846_1 [Eumeta japonica]|uniref:Uncharacterized protein n=1 Tax=Eumeta variegata TaxID=151549 RepID=A0A4C2AHA8_EUMVA|nr:hypothetical protein EVAR_67846_1 [Eumeta japonica]
MNIHISMLCLSLGLSRLKTYRCCRVLGERASRRRAPGTFVRFAFCFPSRRYQVRICLIFESSHCRTTSTRPSGKFTPTNNDRYAAASALGQHEEFMFEFLNSKIKNRPRACGTMLSVGVRSRYFTLTCNDVSLANILYDSCKSSNRNAEHAPPAAATSSGYIAMDSHSDENPLSA